MIALQTLAEKARKLNEEISEKIRTALSESIKELFETYPDLEVVGWIQYRPYFNDGDACLFGVYYVGFLTKEQVEEGFEEDNDIYEWYDDRHGEIGVGVGQFESALWELSDHLEACFGDAKIKARRGKDELEVESYDRHD